MRALPPGVSRSHPGTCRYSNPGRGADIFVDPRDSSITLGLVVDDTAELPSVSRWRRRAIWRRAAKVVLLGALGGFVVIAASVIWVRSEADGYLYSEGDVPPAPVGLVLGAQV